MYVCILQCRDERRRVVSTVEKDNGRDSRGQDILLLLTLHRVSDPLARKQLKTENVGPERDTFAY